MLSRYQLDPLFGVERQTGTDAYKQIGWAVDSLRYFDSDTNLAANTTYSYRVTATNFLAASSSVEASVTTSATLEPFPMTNLFMWVRADAGIVRQTTNETVAIWLDQSGHTNHAWAFDQIADRAMGTNQPQYIANETNNRPVIGFNLPGYASDYLRLPTSAITDLTEAEVYIVHKAAITNSSTQGFWDFGTGDANTHYPDQNGKIQDNFGTSIKRAAVNSTSGLDQYHLYQVITTSSAWTNRVNGTDVFVASPNTVAFDTAPTIGKGK